MTLRYQQGSTLETCRLARRFLEDNKGLFDENGIRTARQNLDDVVVQLTTLGIDQNRSARGSIGETAKQRALGAILRKDHMQPIADIAKLELRNTPEFAKLRMPPANMRATQLVSSAVGMADAATPHAAVLKAEGLPPDFLEKLRAAAGDLATSLDGRNTHRKDRAGSTEALISAERRGRVALRVLDSIVRPQLKDDERLSGEWKAVLKIRRKRVAPAVPSVQPPQTPAAPGGAAAGTA